MARKNEAARKAFAAMGKEQFIAHYNRQYPCIDPEWKPERKRLAGDEVLTTTWLVMTAHAMKTGMQRILADRLSMIPKGMERMQEAADTLDRLSDDICCTLTSGQLLTLDNMDRRGEIAINLQKATDTPNQAVYVHADELHEIAWAAQAGECTICMKEGGEIRSCKLRKAFDECGLCSEQYNEDLGCHYRNQKILIKNTLCE